MEITVNGTTYRTWNDVPQDLRTHLGGAVHHDSATTPPASVQVTVDGATYRSWAEVPGEIRALLAAGETDTATAEGPQGDPLAPEDAFAPGSAAPEAFAVPTDNPARQPRWIVLAVLVVLLGLALALAVSLS